VPLVNSNIFSVLIKCCWPCLCYWTYKYDTGLIKHWV